MSDLLGLEMPGILHRHVTKQPYHKKEKQCLVILSVEETVQVQLTGHWLKAKAARDDISIGGISRNPQVLAVQISYQQRVGPVIFPEGDVMLSGHLELSN